MSDEKKHGMLHDKAMDAKSKWRRKFKSKEIRKTVCSVMSMIMVRGGFNAWQDLLQFLTDNL